VDVVATSRIGSSLAACLRDPSWHPTGAVLGFALQHKYATNGRLPAALEPATLKGTDLLLYKATQQLGLTARLVPVLKTNGGGDESEPDAAAPEEVLVGEGFKGAQTAADEPPLEPGIYDDDEEEEERDRTGVFWNEDLQTEREFLAARHGARPAPQVVWARPLAEAHWQYRDVVDAYGNEACRECWYAAAALLVTVPGAGQGVRVAAGPAAAAAARPRRRQQRGGSGQASPQPAQSLCAKRRR
jgi:hypothetical protein